MKRGARPKVSNTVGDSERNSFNFKQHEHVFDDVPFSCLEKFDSQNLCQPSGDNSTPQFGSVNVESLLFSNEDTFCETYSELPLDDVSLCEHFGQEHNNLEGDDSAPLNQVEAVCATSGNSDSSMVPIARKKRIKWTEELHDQFIAAVNSLGGPQKAKPKAVLQMMNSKSLTIYNVKSHLQKYRTTMCLQKTSEEGYDESQGPVTELQLKIYKQIEETRQLQLEIARGIKEQMEVQRSLQMLVEEQKKQVSSVGGQTQMLIRGSKSWENEGKYF